MLRLKKKLKLTDRLEKDPPLFFLVGYLLVISLGTILLLLPPSHRGGMLSPVDCFFVSTSAVCVTGLSPLVTAEAWTGFGQLVILALIQLGGLGIMTAVAAFGLVTRKHFDLKERVALMEEKGQNGLGGIIRLLKFILLSTFLIEGVGAILLALEFVPRLGLASGIWASVFHSISAFCNAGFDIIGPNSLSPFQNNVICLLTFGFLIAIAGIGYTVYLDLLTKKAYHRLSLHTKVVLTATVFLLAFGTLCFYLLEKDNPQSFGPLSEGAKWLNAFFQSVTTRTAGFFSVDQSSLSNGSVLLTIFLMFIGGSPSGTAGGIKTTTFIAISLGCISEIREAKDVTIFHRNLSRDIIRKAFIIFTWSLFWCNFVWLLLVLSNPGLNVLNLLFETISAFGTVGLTRGITGNLNVIGKLLIAGTMILGKLGPLTMFYALAPEERKRKNRLAEEDISIG